MFKILGKNQNKQSFSVPKSKSSVYQAPLKDSRVWRNVEILKEILNGNLSRASEYSGFGGLWRDLQDQEVQKELKTILDDEQILALVKSTSTAYFTPKTVVEYCWQIVEKLGFEGGKVLEPCCGSGAFFDAMPDNIRRNSDITGIELEAISASIAQAVNSDIKIVNDGYQYYSEQGQDLIIGNPPYATFSVRDKFNPDLSDLKIHHAFLARSIRLLRDGGLCVMVVPSYCLDSSTSHAREQIAEIADLVFSCRLPDSIWEDAKVTTDIVVYRKTAKPTSSDWKGLTKIELACGYKDNLSNYYIENPEHILGDLELYEVYLSKEKRKRQGLKVTGSLAFVNDRLPKLIDQLKPCYESERKAVVSSVVQFSTKSKASAPVVENNELVALRDRLDAVALELSEIVNELGKVA
jgi:type I restriction-modification system DNA methylase subunit